MYSTSDHQQYHQLTQQFLKHPASLQQIHDLRNVIQYHEHRYYVMNDPIIADVEYDHLFQQLVKLEHEHPSAITATSPTQRVGNSLNDGFASVPHLVPMLSLDNSYNADDLLDFDRKAKEISKLNQLTYCVEPKFDGASISLFYENDVLVRAVTRGDGVQGEEVTNNVKQIRSIPLYAPFSKYGIDQIEIRGEVIMSKKQFELYNQEQKTKGLALLANPRNAASGSLRMKDPKEVARRKLEAFLYHISFYTLRPNTEPNELLKTHSGNLTLLWQCGFKAPEKEKIVVSSIHDVIDYCTSFEQKRDNLPYEIDGMVVKVDQLELHEVLGMTSHHPRWAIAFKFKARQATTQLIGVEFQVGRTGAVTPVAKLKPVYLGGVTVSSISIHNEEYIKEKDLMIGDQVLIERAGDVIPQIVKSLPDIRTGNERVIEFPKCCPVCSASLFKEIDEAVWRCINIECEAQVVERIIHFASKDAMDIKNLGEANIRKFYELKLLKDIPGIYTLEYETIESLEGFGKKSIEKLKSAIEASKQQPLYRLIYGLGIRYVGETTAKTLANHVDHILELAAYTEEQLQQLEDVGTKVAKSIAQFFSNSQNIEMLKQLENLGVSMNNIKKSKTTSGELSGQTFLFTGTLSQLKRSEAEALAEKHGGVIVSGVSSKLNYLVVGEDAGSKLEKAKKINTIKIISEAEFLKLIQAEDKSIHFQI